MASELKIVMPEQFKELFNPKWRNIVFYGGRAGGKSENIARALLIKGQQEKRLILCTREIQNSIDDSVHRLLRSLIEKYKMTDYEVQKTTIRNKRTGTEFIFKGLRQETIDSLKSIPNITDCWVEEAHSVSAESIEKLTPTIRADGSQIIWSFNRETPDDPVWVKIVEPGGDDTYICKINSQDVENFLSKTIINEREKMREDNPELYLHVWLGEPRTVASGTVYGKQIAQAIDDGRIKIVPYDSDANVYTSWDLGIGDAMAIWFFQVVGMEIRFIDHYENSGEGLGHYIGVFQNKPYTYAKHFLPHDAKVRELQSGKSRVDFFNDKGIYNVEVLPPDKGDTGIEQARTGFSRVFIDETKCARGLECLKAYHYDYDSKNQILRSKPKHDWSSHSSDAFAYAFMAINDYIGKFKPQAFVPSWAKKYETGSTLPL